MRNKLKEYIDTIFADAERRAPQNRQVSELKEEMLQNLYDRYDDLLAREKSPAAAYNIAIAGVGDVSELIDSLVGPSEVSGSADGFADAEAPTASGKRPLNEEEMETVRRYKSRSAVITSVSIAMYILCWLPLVILGGILGDAGGIAGLAVMFGMIAAATGLLVYNGMTKPKFDATVADWDDDDDDDEDDDGAFKANTRRPARSPAYKAISSLLWIVTFCVYFLVSFASGAWHITWMIFLIATALDNVIKAIFDLRR